MVVMMALATQLQYETSFLWTQSSSSNFPSSWSRVSGLKYAAPKVYAVGRKDRFVSLKCRSCCSVGASHGLGPKSKLFKISAFKGGSQQDSSSGRANGSKSLKDPVKVSYVQHESEDSSLDSPKVQSVVPPYRAENETTTRSLAIQNLFKKWLMLLRTPSQTQSVEVLEATEIPETKTAIKKEERVQILKAAWSFFMGLDAVIKIPLLIFAPLYLAVNLVYGSEVSKELIPLWILGPLITVLYIKMFQAVCGLYVFSFKQTVKVVQNLPVWILLVRDYLFRGKLKEAMSARIWQPLADIKNMDYSAASRRKVKEFQIWVVEKYLDFIESIWPYYCRTIRFLKRANLI